MKENKPRYLTELEKGQITILNEENFTQLEIRKRLGRDISTINRFLNKKTNNKKRKKRGPREKLSKRTKRLLIKKVS